MHCGVFSGWISSINRGFTVHYIVQVTKVKIINIITKKVQHLVFGMYTMFTI